MFLRKVILGAAVSLSAMCAHAAYPEKPVRLVVGFAPGGSADINARLTAAALSERLGKQVVVENRAGASGIVALQAVANSTPDGYTLLFHSSGTHVVTPHLMEMSVNPLEDLDPVVKIAQTGMVIISHPESGSKTFSEFVERAKEEPNQLAYGTAGQGSTHHLVMELVGQQLGFQMVHAGYKGSAPALRDLAGGIIPYAVDTISTAKPLIDDKRVIPLAVTSKKRSSQLSDVATLSELGAGDIDATLWLAIAAPKGTPPEIIDTLNKAVNDALNSADSGLREKLAATGWVDGGGSVQDLKDLMSNQSQSWKSVIQTANISIQ